ncbi:hypothetical protein GF336_04825 [Candidatus Woesearchaeota archaeon]|nr:hypothetical protein [Candidatus Woesearchaeota archaeon]
MKRDNYIRIVEPELPKNKDNQERRAALEQYIFDIDKKNYVRNGYRLFESGFQHCKKTI